MGAALIITAIASAASIQQSRQAAKEQRKALAVERRRSAALNIRSRSKAIENNRIQSAQVTALGENLGVSGSSAIAGGVGGATSTTFGNVGFQQQLEQLTAQRLSALEKASGFASNAATFSAIGSFASSPGGSKTINSIGK